MNISTLKLLRNIGFVLLVLVGLYFFSSKIDQFLYPYFHPASPFMELTSHEPGFPVVTKDKNLSIYSFAKQALMPTSIQSATVKSSLYFRGSSPKVSPDFNYTAFIDEKNRDLWVMSNETLQKNQVTRKGEEASDILGWSPKSKKLLYAVGPNQMSGETRNYQIVSSKPVTNSYVGYYVYDIESGKSIKLPDIQFFKTFVDENRILFRPPEGQYGFPGKHLVTLDLTTLKTDSSLTPGEFDSNADQFSISADLKKWTFAVNVENDPSTEKDSSIVLADFPQKEGVIIASGTWSELQNPLISPTAKKIAYFKQEGSSDVPTYGLMIYDIATKKTTRITEGFDVHWLDDTQLVLESQQGEKYFLVNVVNNTSTPIN